ncbi:MAG TPA: hypothetical protein PKW55_02230 [Spirochaetota bacterium]|nr:hypothetical protein [Spirochaetota bacterium]HOM38334.1 hypothetical protein [Spirochaetota bacterium]HPQ48448.1 hypothetical protein [Spirochaetota bacterium]
MNRKFVLFVFSVFLLALSCSNVNNVKKAPSLSKDVKYYTFTYKGKANQVFMAGNFNNWKVSDPKYRLSQKGLDLWEITLPENYFLKGENEYKFIVDGEWVLDENAPLIRDTKLAGKIGVFKVE